ncbi:hypothetical protein N0V88_005005 [Collariella sp. IMI 366227]|nr:hypothetical protein N0V88_005005 [Collariella sp. IMI 366227]
MEPPPTPEAPLQSRIVDDKSPIVIPFILERLAEFKKQHAVDPHPRPFIIGLNGVQGVGKTTLVRALAETLQDREGLSTLVMSIDDFYLTHADQLALAASHPDNALVQYRGEPGLSPTPIPIPQYTKSAFSGSATALPLNLANPPPPSILLLEGWCIGFRPSLHHPL